MLFPFINHGYVEKESLLQLWLMLGSSRIIACSSWFNFHNENQLTPLHVRIGVKINLMFSHECEMVMRINSFLFFILKNQISSFIEPTFNSQGHIRF